MTQIHFNRRKNYKSVSIIFSIFVIILLLLFIPQMLISRTNTIIKHKLDQTTADTTYVKLVMAARSYLQTADAFIIFRSKDEKLRDQLNAKAQERFLKSCKTVDSTDLELFCQTWAKILTPKQLNQCDKCNQKQ